MFTRINYLKWNLINIQKNVNDICVYFKNKHFFHWPTLKVVHYQYLENSSYAYVIYGIHFLLCCIRGKHCFEILFTSMHFFIILQHTDVTVSILFSFRIVELCIYEIILHIIFNLFYYFRLGVWDSFMVMHIDVPLIFTVTSYSVTWLHHNLSILLSVNNCF